jgi:hypothetical protein
MLNLFHSIFGSDATAAHYPDALVREATERAVDATDPWLRGLTGYRRKLRQAVVHAIDHVIALVDQLEAPLELSRDNYGGDDRLRLFFISPEQLDNLLRTDPALAEFRRQQDPVTQPVWALLAMACEQRRVFGADLVGETVVRDVAQITVSMAGHRLLDPTLDLAETSRMLKRRAFDHILTLALARVVAAQEAREELERCRSLLQAKHEALERAGWSFDTPGSNSSRQVADLHRQLEEIEEQLATLGGDDRSLEKHLEILAGVLASAERQLWSQPLPMIVDRMGIRRNVATDDAPELVLTELHNAAGRRLVVQLVRIPPLRPA